MVRRLVAGGTGIGFLIPENVAEDVAQGRLVWTALADAGADAVLTLTSLCSRMKGLAR